MRMAETVAGWLGRVEVVLAGVEGYLRDGEEALTRGDAMAARRAAKAMLQRVPHSPVGLALLADACEAAQLDAELAITLEELADRVPSRGEVWVRLGRARERVGSPVDEVRDAFLRALAVAEAGSEARREALLLARRRRPCEQRWRTRRALDRAARRHEGRGRLAPAGRGRACSRTTLPARARRSTRWIPIPTDGRAALLRGRALAIGGDAGAFPLLLRAVVLDTPGASEALASALAWIPSDEAIRGKIRIVVEGREETELARWKAAFARAEGRRDEARSALVGAVRGGDTSAARPLLDTAIEDRDHAALIRRAGRARARERRRARRRCATAPLSSAPPRRGRGVRDPGRARGRDEPRARMGGRGADRGARHLDPRPRERRATGRKSSRGSTGTPGRSMRSTRRPKVAELAVEPLAAGAPRHRRRVQRRQEHVHQRRDRRRCRADGRAPDDRNAPPPPVRAGPVRADPVSSGRAGRRPRAPRPLERAPRRAERHGPELCEARRDPPADRVAHPRRDPRHARLQRARSSSTRRRRAPRSRRPTPRSGSSMPGSR